MPIALLYLNGRQRIVEGESWKQLNNAHSDVMGTINLRRIEDGGKITIIKSALCEVEEFTQAAWDKMIEDEKKARADVEAKRKAEQDARDKKAAKDLAAIEAKKFKNRLKRLFGRKA